MPAATAPGPGGGSWQSGPAAQEVEWPDPARLAEVTAELPGLR
jgi:hypothetical protein